MNGKPLPELPAVINGDGVPLVLFVTILDDMTGALLLTSAEITAPVTSVTVVFSPAPVAAFDEPVHPVHPEQPFEHDPVHIPAHAPRQP